jgi:hypothetical protein
MTCHDTQNDRLLAEFKKGKRLSMRQILTGMYINNPWARISELRKRHQIKDDFVTTRGGARIKEYWLVKGRRRAA